MDESNTTQASDKEAWSLDQWLSYLEQIHPQSIELGLERVTQVYRTLQLDFSQSQVITVAGTNGKGTTCALIEQALLAAQKSVGVFSSPHLIDYKERVRISGQMLSEKKHCQAFLKVDQARQGVSLTYFEFGTLQALQLMADAGIEYALLEVGLGGRLDAVNIIDPDIAVITSIGLDHQDWLGDTRELIATEKAGIFRPNIPAIIGEPNPPSTLVDAVNKVGVRPSRQGQDFHFSCQQQHFTWHNANAQFTALPMPHIPLQNASTALEVIDQLKVDISAEQMATVFANTQLPGRRQIIQQTPTVMLDVAHNPQSTALLAKDIQRLECKRVFAVVAMLADKDIQASLEPMNKVVSSWYCAQVDNPRTASSEQVASVLNCPQRVLHFDNVNNAYQQALSEAQKEDLIIVFGSFFTVADVLKIAP